MDGKLCGDVTGEPYAFEVECQLPAGHDGEHYAEVRWPQRERQPVGEQSAMSRLLQTAYAPLVERQLAVPVVGGNRVVNRNEIEA